MANGQICPLCGFDNAHGAAFCGNCGRLLSVEVTEPAAPCPVCGNHNPPGAGFCGECGAMLSAATDPTPPSGVPAPEVYAAPPPFPPPPPAAAPRQRGWLIPLVVLAGLLLLTGVATWFLLPRLGVELPPMLAGLTADDGGAIAATAPPAENTPPPAITESLSDTPSAMTMPPPTKETVDSEPTIAPTATQTPRPSATATALATPSPTPEPVLVEVAVDAATARTQTGIVVQAGQWVRIETVGGGWRAGPASTWPLVGGSGDPQVMSKNSLPVRDRPIMTLVGGVGDGLPFAVGDELTFNSDSGELWLGPNDDNTTDNTGELLVRITLLDETAALPPTTTLPHTPTSIIQPTATLNPPSPSPAACQQSPGPRWGDTLWDRHEDVLGCATTGEIRTNAAYQYYQHGMTVWRQDADRIYVLYDDGSYASYRDDSPEDYYDSEWVKGGFGYLWNNNSTVRSRLGQPQAAEFNATHFAVQDFVGGTIFYFLENDARNYALFAASGTWASAQE